MDNLKQCDHCNRLLTQTALNRITLKGIFGDTIKNWCEDCLEKYNEEMKKKNELR